MLGDDSISIRNVALLEAFSNEKVPMFTTRQYARTAKLLKTQRIAAKSAEAKATVDNVIVAFAVEFKNDNPLFDKGTFYGAIFDGNVDDYES
jgi:hypothetical protein